jgi:hypothetical protein
MLDSNIQPFANYSLTPGHGTLESLRRLERGLEGI